MWSRSDREANITYQLGIDVGTTSTAAAVLRTGARRPKVAPIGSHQPTIPSVVSLGVDGRVLVGEAAERQTVLYPDRIVRGFHQRIGDPTPHVVQEHALLPQELTARVVRWVVDVVFDREGGPARAAVVTHPATWGLLRERELLDAALAEQGVTVSFMLEPAAAALAHSADHGSGAGSVFAVYDLGGEAFAAAIVRQSTSGDLELLGERMEAVGGVDFDQAVFDHVREGLPRAFDPLNDSDPIVLSAVARLRRECTYAKEALSTVSETSIPVLLPDLRGSVRLHRSEFEDLIKPYVARTVATLRRAIDSVGLSMQDLTAVLLVGGSSQIPLVANMVSEDLCRPVVIDADPGTVVARGAALAPGVFPDSRAVRIPTEVRNRRRALPTLPDIEWGRGVTREAAPAPARQRVFVSYRTSDTGGTAGRMSDALSARFGADRVFLDVDSIDAGEDFRVVIAEAVNATAVMLVVIGDRWLSVASSSGRRLDDPDDALRVEIEQALRAGVRVVPVLVDGATMPQLEDLPEELAGLASRNALPLNNRTFRRDIDELLRQVARFLQV